VGDTDLGQWLVSNGLALELRQTKLDALTVCGSPKAVYLGQSGAVDLGKSLADIRAALNVALAKGGSSLPDIECY
jgi:hypothetical protein